jgi:multidrug efflux pump subunit AcrA (membrane-fusion protein)
MPRKIRWELPLVAVIAAVLGIAAGHWLSHADGHTDGHTEPAAATSPTADEHAEPSFTAATIASLGIESAPAEQGAFTIERSLAAVIVDRPTTARVITAPLGGVIVGIEVSEGERVAPGSTLLRVLRDPIPRPSLDVTRPHVFPDHDEIHATFGDLRTAMVSIANAETELLRIERLDSDANVVPVVPRQRTIDLRYEIEHVRARAEHARHELLRHGFTTEQISAVLEHRETRLFDAEHALRCLSHAGLWSESASRALAALPAGIRAQPITVGMVAELDARGIPLDPLAAWLSEDPIAAERFHDVAALLSSGSTLGQVRAIAAQNGLAERIDVPVPPNDGDFQVAELLVRVGEHVEPGKPIARLRDDSVLLLEVRPLGGEIQDLHAAISARTACRATSLLPGAAPQLEELIVAGIRSDGSGTVAWCEVRNPPLAGSSSTPSTTRALQPGMRYAFRIPTSRIDDAFLVPRDALATLAGARVVFLAEGNGHFHPQPVRVLAEDGDRLAVVGADPATNELTTDSAIVVRGAYALAMAMGNAPLEHSHDH